jgi:hypothetical protein
MDVFLRDRADRDVPPVAALTVTRDGRSVIADATASHDPDGPTVSGSITFGDGSPDRSGVIATHEYDRTGTYSVTASIRDADGVTATQTQIVTIADAGVFGPPGPGPSALSLPPSSTPGGTTRRSAGDVLRGISLSRRSFRVAPRRGKPKDGQGTTLTVRLGAAATVGLRFDRMLKGRRRNGKCSARAKKGKRCTMFRQAGTLRRRLKAGSSKVTLTGRIGSRRLPVGRYRLTVTAASERRSLTLTVLKASR